MVACQDSNLDEQNTNVTIDYSQQPDQVAMKFEATFLDEGKVVAILKSGRARVYQDASETLLDSSVYVQFFSKDTGKRMSTLTSDSARIDDRTKDMLAFGNVVVLSDSNSMKLTTSILEWHNQKQRVYSSEFVTITSPDRVIQGYGFESDLKLEDYRIHKVSMIDYNY
jgi:LPS export ABC transporter protein LptC